MRLLDPTPLEPGRKATQAELRELATMLAESGGTAKDFAKAHGIPYQRALRAQRAFEGLILKIRGVKSPQCVAAIKERKAKQNAKVNARRRAYRRRKRAEADRQWQKIKDKANGPGSDE